jgi:ketosteroid isomerase-like protein
LLSSQRKARSGCVPWDAVRHSAERVIDLGDDRILVLSRASGNQKGGNVRISQKSADLFSLNDGKIASWEAYGDRARGTAAAGLGD